MLQSGLVWWMRHAALLRSMEEDKHSSMLWVLGCWSFSVVVRGIDSYIILVIYFIFLCTFLGNFRKETNVLLRYLEKEEYVSVLKIIEFNFSNGLTLPTNINHICKRNNPSM